MLKRVVLLIIAVSMIMVVFTAVPVKADSTSLENRENFSITTSTFDESLLDGSVTGYTLTAGDVLFISWKGDEYWYYYPPRVYLLTEYQFDGWNYMRKLTGQDPASRGWLIRESSWEMTLNYSITSSDTYYVIIDNPNWIPDILPPSIDILFYDTFLELPTSYYLSVRTDPPSIVSILGEGWYTEGSNRVLTAPAIVSVSPNTQYRFEYWDVDGVLYGIGINPITVSMIANHTATAHYALQCKVVFSQTGLDSSAVTTVVSINGVPKTYSQLPNVFWIDNGNVIMFSYNETVSSSTTGKNFVLKDVTGPTSPIMVASPFTVTGNYVTQYYLIVTSPYDSPTPTSGWFDTGTLITASVTSPWPGPTGVQQVCTGWTGTGSVPASGSTASMTFTINMPSSITWTWETQYKLTVKTDQPGLSPGPTPTTDWYDESTDVVLTAQTVSGYTFKYWDVDDASQGSGVNPITVHIDNPHTSTAHYETAAPPPPPVGGKATSINMPMNKPETLTLWIWLSTTILLMVVTVVYVKKRKKNTEILS